jgi:hypothetical protein
MGLPFSCCGNPSKEQHMKFQITIAILFAIGAVVWLLFLTRAMV